MIAHIAEPGLSDHASLELEIKEQMQDKGRSLKFLNVWLTISVFINC